MMLTKEQRELQKSDYLAFIKEMQKVRKEEVEQERKTQEKKTQKYLKNRELEENRFRIEFEKGKVRRQNDKRKLR